MEITLISEKNIDAFSPIIYENMKKREKDTIRLGAIIDGIPVGVVSFRVEDEALSIIGMYILEDYRRQGVATALIKHMLEETASSDTNINVMIANYMKSQSEVGELLRKSGFICTAGGATYSFSFDEVMDNPNTKKYLNAKWKEKSVSVCDLDIRQKNQLMDFLKMNNLTIDVLYSTGFDDKLSNISFGKDDKLQMVLMASRKNEEIVFDLILGQGENGTSMFANFKHVYKLLEKSGELSTRINFAAVNERISKLATYFLGKSLKANDRIYFAIKAIR